MTENTTNFRAVTPATFVHALACLVTLLKESGVDVTRHDLHSFTEYVSGAWLGGDKSGGFYFGHPVVAKIYAYPPREGEYVSVISYFGAERRRNSELTKAWNAALAAAL